MSWPCRGLSCYFCGGAAGVIVQVPTFPFDTLKKRLQASEVPIRHDYDQAVSYFVGAAAAGDDIGIKEDKGFAINPWTAVRFENSKTILNADSATAMGEYYFTTLEGTVAKVEYTFQYKRGADGNLKIVVHHSSLPYSP